MHAARHELVQVVGPDLLWYFEAELLRISERINPVGFLASPRRPGSYPSGVVLVRAVRG
jgi:hypothetical protein